MRMNKKLLSILQYVFFLGLGVFLLWWALHRIDKAGWDDIRNAFANARYLVIIPIVIALLASHYSRAIRWKILMEPLGYSPRTSNTYLAVLIGYMANLAIPRLGEILKCTVLARYEKVPADKLVGTIVAERVFDLICLVIVMALAFITQTEIFGGFLSGKVNEVFGSKTDSLSSTRSLVILGSILIFGLVAWYVLVKFAHISFVKTAKKIVAGVWHGLISVKYVKKKKWFIFHTIFIWTMYLVSVRLGFFALQETSVYSWKEALSVLTSGSLALIVPTPGGLGVYPVFIQHTMDLYNLKSSLGFAFGALMWTVQFFQQLLSGFVALLLFPYFNKKAKADAQS